MKKGRKRERGKKWYGSLLMVVGREESKEGRGREGGRERERERERVGKL